MFLRSLRWGMIFHQTDFPGVVVTELEMREDFRGFFARAWCESDFANRGLPKFVQTNMSLSRRRGMIRGMHYQVAPYGEAKYLRCIRGAVFDVVVDIRPKSPTYKKWFGIELTAQNHKGIIVPEGLPHAHQALTDDAEVIYSCSCKYMPSAERGIRWNDPAFHVDWPIPAAIVSEKDAQWPDFAG